MTNRLKQCRVTAGLSQNQLARKCRMHPAHLCLIEGGASTTKQTAIKLAHALQTDCESVFSDFATLRSRKGKE